MNEIKNLIEKFRKIIQDKNLEKVIILKILKEKLGDEIKEENLKIKKGVLFLKVNNYIKTEITLKKEEFLREFKKNGIENITDIK